ncbi:MAG TPA: glycosyl transferase family 2, partial [Nitrospirae bacterium]|nr:glycosyl transferase family 2 [Nitrospirota bacterium]
PLLMSFGIGMSVNNSKAVLEAVFNRDTEFKRTPKYNVEKKKDKWADKKYKGEKNFLPIIELFLGFYFTFNIYFALINGIYVSIPFLMIFQVGFFYVAFLSIFQVTWARVAASRFIRFFAPKKEKEDAAAAQ